MKTDIHTRSFFIGVFAMLILIAGVAGFAFIPGGTSGESDATGSISAAEHPPTNTTDTDDSDDSATETDADSDDSDDASDSSPDLDYTVSTVAEVGWDLTHELTFEGDGFVFVEDGDDADHHGGDHATRSLHFHNPTDESVEVMIDMTVVDDGETVMEITETYEIPAGETTTVTETVDPDANE